MTIHTEVRRVCTIDTGSALRAYVVRAIQTHLSALPAYRSTVAAAVSASAYHLYAGDTKRTIKAKIPLSYAIRTKSAIDAKLVVCTILAFFITFGADLINALGATAAAYADELRAHLAGFAIVTEIAVSPCTILTDIASPADLGIGAVGTFFITLGAKRRTLHTPFPANTDSFYAVLAFSALGAIVTLSAYAVKAYVAAAAQLSLCAILTFLVTFGADLCAIRATVSANAKLIHAVLAFSAFGTVVAFSTDTVKAYTARAAYLIVRTVGTFFVTFGTYLGAL